MLNREYKQAYIRLFRDILNENDDRRLAEAALPSYAHNNPLMAWLFWKRIESALAMAGDLRNRTVLDFGCGGGVTFGLLAGRNCRITGCDNGTYGLAREVSRRMKIDARIVADLATIRGETFDCILALDVLEHVEDVDVCLDELLAASRPGTIIVISGPTETPLYKLGLAIAGFSGDYHVRNIYDIEGTIKSKNVEQIGLKRLYFPFTLFRITSWRVT